MATLHQIQHITKNALTATNVARVVHIKGGTYMTNQEEKQTWLDGLQVGDRVLIRSRMSSGITTIEKITKTRRIITKNGYRFNADGSECGRGSSWDYCDIEPVTDEVIQEFKMRKIAKELEKVNWYKVNFGNLKKIAEILEIKA